MTSGFRKSNAGQTVRKLKLLCQKTSHHFAKLNISERDGCLTIRNPSPSPLRVWVTTVTSCPIRQNSSASKPLTVSIPPMLGAKACDDTRIFKSLRVIGPDGAQHPAPFRQFFLEGRVGSCLAREDDSFHAVANENQRLDQSAAIAAVAFQQPQTAAMTLDHSIRRPGGGLLQVIMHHIVGGDHSHFPAQFGATPRPIQIAF